MAVNRFDFWQWVGSPGPKGLCYWRYHAECTTLRLKLYHHRAGALHSVEMNLPVVQILRHRDWRPVVAAALRSMRRDLRRLKAEVGPRTPHRVVREDSRRTTGVLR